MNSTTETTGQRRVIAYASSAVVDNGVQVGRQLDAIHRYAQLQGLTVDAIYLDQGYSGMRQNPRQGMAQVIADAERHPGALVLVYAIDRMGRSVAILNAVFNALQDAHADLYCVRNGVGSHEAALLYLQAQLVAMHSAELSARIRASKGE